MSTTSRRSFLKKSSVLPIASTGIAVGLLSTEGAHATQSACPSEKTHSQTGAQQFKRTRPLAKYKNGNNPSQIYYKRANDWTGWSAAAGETGRSPNDVAVHPATLTDSDDNGKSCTYSSSGPGNPGAQTVTATGTVTGPADFQSLPDPSLTYDGEVSSPAEELGAWDWQRTNSYSRTSACS